MMFRSMLTFCLVTAAACTPNEKDVSYLFDAPISSDDEPADGNEGEGEGDGEGEGENTVPEVSEPEDEPDPVEHEDEEEISEPEEPDDPEPEPAEEEDLPPLCSDGSGACAIDTNGDGKRDEIWFEPNHFTLPGATRRDACIVSFDGDFFDDRPCDDAQDTLRYDEDCNCFIFERSQLPNDEFTCFNFVSTFNDQFGNQPINEDASVGDQPNALWYHNDEVCSGAEGTLAGTICDHRGGFNYMFCVGNDNGDLVPAGNVQ